MSLSTFSQETQALLGGVTASEASLHRDKLAARILLLKREIEALEGRYNTLSLPNCIPPEILSNVFLLLARDARLLIYPNDKETLDWIRVTHVCRH